MRKSFFLYTLTLLKKNCPHYLLLLVVASLPALHLKKNVRWEAKASWCVNYPIPLH